MALSYESPTVPIDWVIPIRSQHALNSLLVYWQPWSEWNTVPAKKPLPRAAPAAAKASVHSSARRWSAIDQPTTVRVHTSSTEATNSQPSSVGM